MWQNLSTFPWAECWVDSKASRVKCTTASPLTPFHLLGCSKTIRSGRSRKPVKACEATAQRLGLYWLEATQRSVVGVQGLSRRRRLHPCHVANAGGAAPTVLTSPQGARSRGQMCQRHSFQGLWFYSCERFGTKCSEYTDAACGAKARQLANSPTGYLTIFKCSCRASMSLS